MVTGSCLVDTNVLIYATLNQDPRHVQAVDILESRRKADLTLFLSSQNLSEMYPNLTGPKTVPPDAPALARRKIEAIASLDGITILPVTREVVEKALELCETYSVTRQKYYDMQLVAQMLHHGIRTLLTENVTDFQNIREISVVNPFRAES